MSAWPFWLFVIFAFAIFGAIVYSTLRFVSDVIDHITAPPPPPPPKAKETQEEAIEHAIEAVAMHRKFEAMRKWSEAHPAPVGKGRTAMKAYYAESAAFDKTLDY